MDWLKGRKVSKRTAVIIFVLVYAMYLFKSEEWFKKILEYKYKCFKKILDYNKPENIKRRIKKVNEWIFSLNNKQKALLLLSINFMAYGLALEWLNHWYWNDEGGLTWCVTSLVAFFGVFIFKDKNR